MATSALARVPLHGVALDDKYTLESGRIFLTGIQALVRLPIMQRQRDSAAGLNTSGFISGYRGSPLGGLDQQLWQARKFLDNNHIKFQPGLNEDLAATAVWGSQQVNIFEGAKYDGVFALWYGKGPGVDRSGDVFKHANAAGTSKHGGVLVIAGDDHTCKSSTLPNQTEYAFIDAMMPVLSPSNVQEILDYGLYGIALSRYSGCWVGFKTIADVVDSSASVYVDPQRVQIQLPEDFELPADGLHIRWPDKPLEQEQRLHKYKLYAALAFARANQLNRTVIDSPNPRLGIVTTGKAYLDVLQALDDLGIDERHAAEIGLRVYKVGMPWPLEREGVRRFAEGLDEILVVEEKRGIVENQLKEQLYNWREDVRPRVIGKFDERSDWILPSAGELTPARIARLIAARIGRFYTSPVIQRRLAFLEQKERELAKPRLKVERAPHYCSGCPHNTSTKVPEGSRAMAGIGCHYMATWMDRRTETFTQMGGEGVTWIGQAPFTETPHVFQNLGDGTYFHSGILAIRAAVAAKVNITYKLLFNDAVAMTGGQPIDGTLTVPQITHQLAAEGVSRVLVMSDEPEKYTDKSVFAPGVSFHHRRELDAIQRELREQTGVSVLIYDQTCAAEKRRRRKRGKLADPPKRAFINELVCEGCGDCSVQSNCLSVEPVETEFGRKRQINQSSCNKDFTCVDGFCPSFVTVHGGQLRKPATLGGPSGGDIDFPALPEPTLAALDHTYSILITGIGGTGVVTIGALLGMAAHLENKGVSVLDMTGLAQKFGAVVSHIRIADAPETIRASRIPAGEANLLLACDLAVAASFDALAKLKKDHSVAVINTHQSMPAEFIRKPDLKFHAFSMERSIVESVGQNRVDFVDATRLATRLLGDSIAANLFMLGYAYQKGLLPLSGRAIEKAIELNGVAVEFNRQAFLWGRRAAHDLTAVQALVQPVKPAKTNTSLDSIASQRMDYLTAYQNRAYTERYRALVDKVRALDSSKELSKAVARNYFKLLAYKDEYEVARLYTDGAFEQQLKAQFEGDYRLQFHLAPPIFSKPDPKTGKLEKRTYGPWMLSVFKLLAKLKGLRGTPLDIFGYSAERKQERALIQNYETLLNQLLPQLGPHNYQIALELASLPAQIRGYGHIKAASLQKAEARQAELLKQFHDAQPADRTSAKAA